MVFVINGIGIALILLIIWWFWLHKPKMASVVISDKMKIIVEKGVYLPDIIRARKGQELILEFLLQDDSHCAKTVIFPDFDISKELTLNKVTALEITPDKIGEFTFHCPMNMIRGKLIVEEADEAKVGCIDIVIDGGVYTPETITVPVGRPVQLRFSRKDESHCAEVVIFEDFSISEIIPLGEPKIITIKADKPGKYEFHCPMGMYQGRVIAE